jgi:hypothetical protein
MTNTIRRQPCDGLRASELLVGICPNRVCPVTAVSPDPNHSSGSSGGIPQLDPNAPIQPSQDVLDQVDQLLEEAQALTTPDANAADPSVAETGQEGSDAAADDLPSGETAGESATEEGAAADDAAADDAAADAAVDEGSSEGDQLEETGNSGEGDSSGENGEETADSGDNTTPEETGTEGESTESGAGETGTEGGDASGEGETGETGDESGSETAAANNSEQTSNEPGAETAVNENGEPEATAAQPPRVAPDIPTPEESPTPFWVWLLIGMALLALGGGAIMLIVSQRPQPEPTIGPREPATSAEAVDVGRELMLAGNYRAAVRHIFLAALLALDERSVLHYDTTRTNYELLQELQFKPYVVKHLAPVVETFERVWYGFEAVDIAEYDDLVGQIDLLKQV